jgi:uncharacterized membrane protein
VPHHAISPNLHVILIHYPLGLIIVGVLIELFSFLWRRSGFRAAGRWMILIGVASAIPAATSGMYALYDVMGNQMGTTLKDMKASAPLNDQQWHMIRDHVKLNSIAAGIMAIAVVTWLGSSDRWRRTLHWPLVIVLLIGVGMMISGAWHGGEMVYRLGTAVQMQQPSESQPSQNKEAEHEHGEENEAPLGKAVHIIKKPVEKVADMVDVHVIAAGWTVALALISLGLSIRSISSSGYSAAPPDYQSSALERQISGALSPEARSAAERRGVLIETTDLPTDDRPVREVPAARFFLIVALLGLLTAVGGLIIIEPGSLKDLVEMIKENGRYIAHTCAGVGIVVLSVLLSIIARLAPRSKGLLLIFGLLLVCAIAAQVWFGILLLYDTPTGPLTKFN